MKAADQRAKKKAAIERAQEAQAEIVIWALRLRPVEELEKFIAGSEGGLTIRMFGPVSGGESGQITIELSRSQIRTCWSLSKSTTRTDSIREMVSRALPFLEEPIVMFSTNTLTS